MSEEQTSVAENTNEATTGSEEQTTTTTTQENLTVNTETGTQTEQTENAAKETLLAGVREKESEEKTDGEESKEKQEAEKQKGAPEKYEPFKSPEGAELDDAVVNQFSEVAKELNLSQDQAQAFIDKMAPVMAQRGAERVAAVSTAWHDRSIKIPEITNGLKDIARIRDRFAINADGNVDPDIAEFMSSPVGNHPGCLKLLARAGRAFGEANFPTGKKSDGVIRAQDIYQ